MQVSAEFPGVNYRSVKGNLRGLLFHSVSKEEVGSSSAAAV